MCNSYALDSCELAVLLAGLGANELYGLNITKEVYDRASIVQVMHSLSIRSFLTPENRGFSIEPGLRQCLFDCISAKRVIRILPRLLAPICCYSSRDGNMAVLEPSNVQPDGWLLRRIKAGELVALLRDKEYLPLDFNAETQRMRESLLRYWKEREEQYQESEPLLQFELVGWDSVVARTILIMHGTLDDELIYEAEHVPYSEDRLDKAIRSWVDL